MGNEYGQSVILVDASTGKPVSIDSSGRLSTDASLSGDVTLGAVEIKDSENDVRTKVEALGGKESLYVRGAELAQISGDSAAIKTAVEKMDNSETTISSTDVKRVAIYDDADNQITQFGASADDMDAFTSGDTGVTIVAGEDGSNVKAISMSQRGSKRALTVEISDASGNQITSFGLSVTDDAASGTELTPVGGKYYGEAPDALDSGDAGFLALTEYRKIMTGGYNEATGVVDVSDIVPPENQTLESTLLNAVTATGDSGVISPLNHIHHTFHLTASGISTGGSLKLFTSLDNSNWYELYSGDITANGVYEYTYEDKYKYVKANIHSRTDGTYTVKYLGGR